MVSDSISQLRKSPVPIRLDDVVSAVGHCDLGKMSAYQVYLYYFVRILRPAVVVETGVYRGISSAFILAAMADNFFGRLYSIDLPNARYYDERTGRLETHDIPNNSRVGFAIPEELKSRWVLRLGDSRTVLPELLAELPRLDVFLHDGEHTYSCMKWEFESALAHLAAGGLLLSDNIEWNSAFDEVSRSPRVKQVLVVGGRFGVAQLLK